MKGWTTTAKIAFGERKIGNQLLEYNFFLLEYNSAWLEFTVWKYDQTFCLYSLDCLCQYLLISHKLPKLANKSQCFR